MSYYTVKVPKDYEKNERLDKYVSSIPNGMNRSKLKSGIVSILVNGKTSKLSCKIKAGDCIDIEWEDNVPENIEPEDIPLDIIFEDENVCVINKKQGMVTHPACGNWTGTLVNALLFHWNRQRISHLKNAATDAEILKKRRPGIVHRLDKDTSGIIITAKNRDAEEWLGAQFRNHHKLIKEYIAICMNRPQHKRGIIRTQIIRDPKNRKIFRAVTDTQDGKFAQTEYYCIACYGEYSLMRIRIATGRTHQIRVHMKFLNCPILGDSLYAKKDKVFTSATLMLHARLLKIRLPENHAYHTFKTRTPVRFKKILKELHGLYPKVLLSDDR
ncbi:MAG: RluA family pseudouridine synthase [Treponema sp.]|nr:RluA family pseudouridine synthase [Treponema sp.]